MNPPVKSHTDVSNYSDLHVLMMSHCEGYPEFFNLSYFVLAVHRHCYQ